MSPPSRFWSRLVRCVSTCTIACCNAGGRLLDAASAPRLANSGAWLPCWVTAVSLATATAARSSGVNRSMEAAALSAGLAAAATGAFGVKVTASKEAPSGACEPPGTIESLMPLSVCDTASRKVCPACSGTSESTSIDKPAMAIRTRFSASVLSTVALTSVPDCKTNPGAAAPGVVAITGSVGVTVMAMSQGLGFKP